MLINNLMETDPDPEDKDEDLTSLLDGLDDEGSESTDNDDDDKKPSKPTDNKKEVASLIESNKNLQEKVRQLSEQNKENSIFIDRIKGVSDDDKSKEDQIKMLRSFDDDPVATVKMLVSQAINKTNQKVDKNETANTLDRAMREIDKEYIVNWEKDYHKIVPLINDFSKDFKVNDPKGVLVKASKLAGVIKRRKTSAPPYIEGEGSGTGGIKKKPSESDRIKSGILKAGKKSDNVFGI